MLCLEPKSPEVESSKSPAVLFREEFSKHVPLNQQVGVQTCFTYSLASNEAVVTLFRVKTRGSTKRSEEQIQDTCFVFVQSIAGSVWLANDKKTGPSPR